MKKIFSACVIVVFTIIFIVGLLVPKGLWFYFVLSPVTIYQYFYCIQIRKYAFSRILIYDFLLTAVMFVWSLWMPLANFSPLSYKDALLFWNFYIFLFVIGFILMKKIISIEIVEEVQLEEFSILDHPDRLKFDFEKGTSTVLEDSPNKYGAVELESDR